MNFTDIANSALIKLGQDRIAALSDTTNNAEIMNTRFEMVKRATLRDKPWQCAKKRVLPALLVTEPAFGYTYEHQLPTDYIRVIDITPTGTFWRIEGQKILSNSNTLELVYIWDIDEDNAQDIDDLLGEAIAYHLAWDTCVKITNDGALRDQMERGYRMTLAQGAYVSSTEDSVNQAQITSWTTAIRVI